LIQICKNCGAVNSETVARCCFCDEPFAATAEVSSARAAGASVSASAASSPSKSTSTDGNLAVRPANWQDELATRLEAYRARRRKLFPDDLQAGLPFRQSELEGEEEALDPEEAPRHAPLLSPHGEGPQMYRSLPLRSPRAQGIERVEIAVSQPESDSDSGEARPNTASAGTGSVIPVAPLANRRHAALIDALLLLLAYAGFLGMFHAFGGRLTVGKFDALVLAVALALFYAQYFALFTVFGGETPGMSLCKLRVVSFDGSVPTSRQLLWRSFGYLVSAGTAFLGFLWALWDEDHLTWQDRISQTYLTNAPLAKTAEKIDADMDEVIPADDRPGVQWRRTTR
jgi:uncharacterized RDD family membrane protein YckC